MSPRISSWHNALYWLNLEELLLSAIEVGNNHSKNKNRSETENKMTFSFRINYLYIYVLEERRSSRAGLPKIRAFLVPVLPRPLDHRSFSHSV